MTIRYLQSNLWTHRLWQIFWPRQNIKLNLPLIRKKNILEPDPFHSLFLYFNVKDTDLHKIFFNLRMNYFTHKIPLRCVRIFWSTLFLRRVKTFVHSSFFSRLVNVVGHSEEVRERVKCDIRVVGESFFDETTGLSNIYWNRSRVWSISTLVCHLQVEDQL